MRLLRLSSLQLWVPNTFLLQDQDASTQTCHLDPMGKTEEGALPTARSQSAGTSLETFLSDAIGVWRRPFCAHFLSTEDSFPAEIRAASNSWPGSLGLGGYASTFALRRPEGQGNRQQAETAPHGPDPAPQEELQPWQLPPPLLEALL